MDAAVFTVILPGGGIWTPQFAQRIDQTKCIGCGRCYRVCGRDVLQMAGVDEEGQLVPVELTAEDDDDEYEKKVMTIAHPENCVGCEACSKICPKKCYMNGPIAR